MRIAPQCCYETCLVDHKRKFVYAYIPKAACTSIKTWLVRSVDFAPEFAARLDQAEAAGLTPRDASYPRVHAYLDDNASLKHAPRQVVLETLADPSYFKFTFVRNPLSRLVSAYLDKVVNVRRPAWRLIRNSQLRHAHLGFVAARNWFAGQPFLDRERSLTFREFIGQLGRENQERLDPHFRSQSRLIRGLPLDFVGRVEDVRRDFAVVQTRFGIGVSLANQHPQNYRDDGGATGVADWTAAEFRTRSAAPSWPRFYDSPLLARVQTLFAADFAQFGYECKLGTAGQREAA